MTNIQQDRIRVRSFGLRLPIVDRDATRLEEAEYLIQQPDVFFCLRQHPAEFFQSSVPPLLHGVQEPLDLLRGSA